MNLNVKTFNIVELKGGMLREYDELVENSYEGTVFHYTWWHEAVLEGLENYRKYSVSYFGVLNRNDQLLSAIPIFHYRKVFLRGKLRI